MPPTGPAGALNPDPMVEPLVLAAFPSLCAAAGIPNARWQACWDAIMVPGTAWDGSIAGQAALDKALRAWWKKQGGVILGTALVLGGILGG